MSRKSEGLQSLRDAFAGCFDESLAQGPKSEEERSLFHICLNRQEVIYHFACKLHSGDLHEIGKFAHRFDIDPDTTMSDGYGHQFSGVANAEVELFRHSPVAARIEPGLSTVIASKGDILRRTIETFAQKYSCCCAGCGDTPLVPAAAKAANL